MAGMLFDTHAHFDGLSETDVAEALDRAEQAGVARILAVGGSKAANETACRIAREFPDRIVASVGYDRDQSGLALDEPTLAAAAGELQALAGKEAAEGRAVAMGELGLDFHYSPETADLQEQLLRRMLQLAGEMRLPAIVHSRDADGATVRALRRHCESWEGRPDGLGVLHCFTRGREFARELLELGYYISFSGIVTFRNADDLREVARIVPEDRLLIETDSPYLAPIPHRGRKNEPAYLPCVAETLAEVRRCSRERVAEVTFQNAARLFGVGGERR